MVQLTKRHQADRKDYQVEDKEEQNLNLLPQKRILIFVKLDTIEDFKTAYIIFNTVKCT